MIRRISLAELLSGGVVLDAHEAVAIAQQIIHMPGERRTADAERQPPSGPPTPDTIYVDSDGTVCCPTCEATPAVSEIGILLQTLLPAPITRVSGSLRYTIARALLDVDAPPFDSLDDFSRALIRYERGDRRDVVRGVLERAIESRSRSVVLASMDRRRSAPSATDLRRHLREADARIYDQQLALEALAALAAAPRRSPRRTLGTVAAGMAIGLTVIGAGQLIGRSDAEPAPAPVVTQQRPTVDTTPPPVVVEPAVTIQTSPTTPTTSANPANQADRANAPHLTNAASAPIKRKIAGRPSTSPQTRTPAVRRAASTKDALEPARERHTVSPGILSRLFPWLRMKVAPGDDF